jgi:hypothetical protein
MTAKVKYEEMLPHEVLAARTARPVAYLPIGACSTQPWAVKSFPQGAPTICTAATK